LIKLKHEAEEVFEEAVRAPNEATVEALEQAGARQGLESFTTLDDLFEDLGI